MSPNQKPCRRLTCRWLELVLLLVSLSRTSGQTADDFNPNANGIVQAVAEVPGGKIIVGGSFTTIGGQPCNDIGRLNPDGTLDMTFKSGANGTVLALAVQPDGKVLVGGTFTLLGDQSRTNLGRLNPDGTLDTAFNPNASGSVAAMVVQPDGKIVVGSSFAMGGYSCTNLGRLNPDGTLDTMFNAGANNWVCALALQPDGSILAGGFFTMLGGAGRLHIGRLNPNGTLDPDFNPGAGADAYGNCVYCLAVQPDGKILVGGSFFSLAGQTQSNLGRLTGAGAFDPSFKVQLDSAVRSLALQTDGKILAGGSFTRLNLQSCHFIGRLQPDGTVDTNFNASASYGSVGYVTSVSVQEDGKILVAGAITNLCGQLRNEIGRLNNSEAATQAVTYDGTNITWLRGGTSPELWRTTFDFSTNGADWVSLGSGERITGGWLSAATALPALGTVRARGFVGGSQNNGSGWFVQEMIGAPVIVSQPADCALNAGMAANFRAAAAGSLPLAYQWCFNNVSVPNATASTYTRSNAQPADAGSYFVVITNAYGAVTSAPATLTVNFTLTANATVGGTVVRNPAQTSYTPNSTVTLTAIADSSYAFTGWSGDTVATNNPLTMLLTTNKSITANFVSADIMLDNTNAAVTFVGAWQTGTSSVDKSGADYRFAVATAGGLSNATYRPCIFAPGCYDVYLWYPQGSNRATNAFWSIAYNGGSTNVAVNQQTHGGSWFRIGAALPFAQGTEGYVRVSNDTGYSSGSIVVIADAVRFLLVAAPPGLATAPQSLTTNAGANVTFAVIATGSPLSYQWRFNGPNITGARTNVYARTNVQDADAGSYSVVVSNVAGMVTSADAVLTVVRLPPTRIDTIALLPNQQFRIRVSASPGHYAIDATTDFVTWDELTNFMVPGPGFQYTDSQTGLSDRFYRARLIP
jgi:uncharacterized delta-60 repeat protein